MRVRALIPIAVTVVLAAGPAVAQERPVTALRGAAMCAAAADMLVVKHGGGEDLQSLASIWRENLAEVEPDEARRLEAIELERVTFDRGDAAQASTERSFAEMYLRTACLSAQAQAEFVQRYSGAQ